MWAELCRLCERPAADGGHRAAELDKEKLLNFLETDLAYEVKDDDLFCYFCVWDARYYYESVARLMENKEKTLDSRWWPELDSCDMILYKGYEAGKVKQCWIPLTKVQLEEATQHQESEERASTVTNVPENNLQKTLNIECCYCGQIFARKSRWIFHIKSKHSKTAIRCNYHKNCCTYFKTTGERESHVKEFHMKPKSHELYDCIYCQLKAMKRFTFLNHVKLKHSDVAIKCHFKGCASYFKSEAELAPHIEAKHKSIEESKKFQCSVCNFRSKSRIVVVEHEIQFHQRKAEMLKCSKCPKKFTTRNALQTHTKKIHIFRKCQVCNLQISASLFFFHLKKPSCVKCKTEFDCRGQLEQHKLKGCRPEYYCDLCPKVFNSLSPLKYHIHKQHIFNVKRLRALKYLNLGIKCTICTDYFSSSGSLSSHMKNVHNPHYQSLTCAHCSRQLSNKTSMGKHLAVVHKVIETRYSCEKCPRKFYTASNLKRHFDAAHIRKKMKCKICKREMLDLKLHMNTVHGVNMMHNSLSTSVYMM
ncbi:zinc finger protein 808-like [Neocloeon triangulifer]|uniref:zinc finger protein 808-like n=1 Tax=Neocloeon triangulifer TaxID=2078957 RepID=UPI00286EB4B1|nr:zinc finger protein 808-like [Neocloeon triangulifer]